MARSDYARAYPTQNNNYRSDADNTIGCFEHDICQKKGYYSSAHNIPVMSTTLSPFRLCTYSRVPARIMACQCCPSSVFSVVTWFLAISSFIRSRHLNFGLPRVRFPSTAIFNAFLVASYLSRLCTNHLNLFSLRNSAIR